MLQNKYSVKLFLILSLVVSGYVSGFAQGTQVDFSTIPRGGTILIYSHMDDDLIWMLPFWNKTEKFIGGAMPATPSYRTIISQQQTFLNNNGYNIDYQSNWYTPWDDISDTEYTEYYWGANSSYSYLLNDHLETRLFNDATLLSRFEINKIKAKLEQYFADPSMTRAVTHNNWGEYGHRHHIGLNQAVRELAVKYRKDVWMLGCDNGGFVDVTVPNGIIWAYGSFNTPDLYTGIRTIYVNNGRWTWYTDRVPSGDHKFIKIVDSGSDKSAILKGDQITYPGPSQLEPGAYIFDGNDDYLTLKGNNNRAFTIAMRIRPDQIRGMDIAAMAEYPLSAKNDRNLYLTSDGHITARIFDVNSEVVTSNAVVNAGTWSHIAITSNGSNLKLYINGILDGTITAGTAITNYSTPELVLGQATETSNYFSGQISSVRSYNYAMTDGEIANLSGMVYTISSSAGEGGTIDPSGNVSVVVGTSKTFTITPGTGFKISDITVDNVSQGVVSSFTFNNITSDHTISATFSTSTTYTINSSAGEGGSVSPSGDVIVNEGSSKTFTFSPGLGYRVADVKVDSVSVGAVSSFTFSGVYANHTISVTFEPTPTYTISVTSGAGGSVTPSGTVTVNEGTNNTFNIRSTEGYRIADVLADGVSVGAVSTYTFSNVTSNHTLSATFSIITFTVTSSAGSGGSISPSGTTTLNYGSTQKYSITPNTGYQISNVIVDNVSVGAPSEFTFSSVVSNHTIAVTFSLRTFIINATATTGGTVSPQGNVTVSYGGNQTFVVSANTGYYISDVKADNVSVGQTNSYTFNNVTTGHTFEALFAPVTYTITASSGTGGTISPAGNVSVNHGTNRTFTITPDFGFMVADVRVDNASVGAVTTYTFSNITSNHSISVSYKTAEYTITASAGNGGSINPSGNYTAIHGTSRTYTISPLTGFRISDVRVDNISVGALSTYTFSNITSNHTISALFEIITYTIASEAGTGGSVNPGGTFTAEYGSSRTIIITPNTGYQVSDVLVDGLSVGPVASYSFTNITGNHNLTASFSIITFNLVSSAGNGGSITPSGSGTVNFGSTFSYRIVPEEGYYISNVKIDNISAGALSSYTFSNITGNHTIEAEFKILSFSINSTSGNGGSIDPSGITTINYGEDHTFMIIPETGYQVDDVTVDNNSAGNVSQYTFSNVKGNHSISASFSIIRYSVTAEGNAGGSINPGGTTVLNYGSDLTFTFTPDLGYRISDVKVDGVSKGSVNSYSLMNITANHTVSVIFKLIATYTIEASPGTGGTMTPSGPVTILEGSEQTYSIIPSKGYRIKDVVVDGKSVGAVTAYTFSNIASNHKIRAEFTTSIDVKAYPNPFIDEFNISIASPEGLYFEISISDAGGRTIYTQTKIEGNTITHLDLKVPQGFYIMRVFTGGQKIATVKIIRS